MHNFYLKWRILLLYIYLVGITMVTEHFSQSLIYDTKNTKKKKSLYFPSFTDWQKKTFGLTYIWEAKTDLGNNVDKTNFFLYVKILASQIYAVSKATSGKRLLTENNLSTLLKRPQKQSHLTPLFCKWWVWSLIRWSELFNITKPVWDRTQPQPQTS